MNLRSINAGLLLLGCFATHADEIDNGNGTTTGCNGYSQSGEWVSCSDGGSGDSSSSSLSERFNQTKESFNNEINSLQEKWNSFGSSGSSDSDQ